MTHLLKKLEDNLISNTRPASINDVLSKIHSSEYLLPSIQRNFVWSQENICELFDSLMHHYPIGYLLLGKFDASTIPQCHSFISDPSQNNLGKIVNIPLGQTRYGILDGQQRLTALNIGLYGSWTDENEKISELYINLISGLEDSSTYFDFKFLSSDKIPPNDSENLWIKVKDAPNFDLYKSLYEKKTEYNLPEERRDRASYTLNRLKSVFQTPGMIFLLIDETGDLSRTLEIFIRLNRTGAKLTTADLIFAQAAACWKKDPRKLFQDLAEQLKDNLKTTKLTEDWLLTASRVCSKVLSSDIKASQSDLKKKLPSKETLQDMEAEWPRVEKAVRLTSKLLKLFKITEKLIVSPNSLISIVLYLYLIEADDSFLKTQHEHDRKKIYQYLIRVFLRGNKGKGGNTILLKERSILKQWDSQRETEDTSFPYAELVAGRSSLKLPLDFDEKDIDELLCNTSKDPTTILLLSLLDESIDFDRDYHIDHVFPKTNSLTGIKCFQSIGYSLDEARLLHTSIDQLPNLVLLSATRNWQKNKKMPCVWFKSLPPREQESITRHYFQYGDLPSDLNGFSEWFKNQRRQIKEKISQILKEAV